MNFKLNCSFESFSTGENLSLEFSPCLLQELFNAVLKKNGSEHSRRRPVSVVDLCSRYRHAVQARVTFLGWVDYLKHCK